MAEVSIRNVTKSYGDVEVLHGISIDVQDGEFVVIVGPSGCGKSTLLRMVAGLEVITSGEIAIKGRVVNNIEPKDRDIAMVFQNYALYPHMSVFNNMAYGLKLMGLDKAEIRRRVDVAAKTLQLEEFLTRKPRQLSGGQRQRVAMGRAIVRNPAVFLFDEPLSNLDAKLRVQMRVEIRKLQHRLGVTSLYVTHDQTEAMTMADRLIVLNDGIAEQIGAPMDLYNDPASRFVAGFIGSPAMNFIEAQVEDTAIRLGEGVFLPRPEWVRQNGKVIVGVRPEHFVAAGNDEPGLDIKVDVVEALGPDTLLHGHIPGVKTDLVIKFHGSPHFAVDSVVRVSTAPEMIYLFDPETGQRRR